RAIDRKGAVVILHDGIKIIRAVNIEADMNIEVAGVGWLDIPVIDGDEAVAVRSRLGVIKREAMTQFVRHDECGIPIKDINDLLTTDPTDGGIVARRVLNVNVIGLSTADNKLDVCRVFPLLHGDEHSGLVWGADVRIELV